MSLDRLGVAGRIRRTNRDASCSIGDSGAIAQLGERNTGSVEVSGSIPLSSTIYRVTMSSI